MLGQFEGVVEVNGQYVVGTVVVAQCKKAHGLVGTGLLNVDFSQMSINNMNACEASKCTISDTSESRLGCLTGSQVHII